MDGFKKRLNTSLQFRLSFMLALSILGIALVAGAFSFVSAYNEAHELQDDVLRQVAALVAQQPLPPDSSGGNGRDRDDDPDSRVIVQQINDTAGPLTLPATLPDGLQSLKADGEKYRVMVKTLRGGERIAVVQQAGFRDEIARDSALRTVMPFLLLIPVLLLIVADLVHKMFLPITVLSNEIDQRSEQELHPVEDGHLPVEVRPFVLAINRLLGRVDQTMAAQRRFVADAAHELRSPLTALSLQSERMAEANMSPAARERLDTLRQGIQRSKNLLDQLLALAKAQSHNAAPKATVSVQAIYRRVLEDIMPLADAKQIDIGVEGQRDAHAWASELDMFVLVKNLVDNAIRYTPEHGRVDLSVGMADGRVVMTIKDTGPGIPIAERERVYDPFYRILGTAQAGSGLGLAIVKTTAEKIGAQVRLSYSDEDKKSGLCVNVILSG
ncbi:MAG: two-component sensor histidine kinase [Gallionellaceae bacterium]|nr:MAG: two-component sensor histidine kinase [Gallionellaceae bacterium]